MARILPGRRRVDLSYQFQDKATMLNKTTSHYERPAVSPWRRLEARHRVDMPFVQNDKTSRDNPGGLTHVGTGDVLLQAILIDSLTDRFAYGAVPALSFPRLMKINSAPGNTR